MDCSYDGGGGNGGDGGVGGGYTGRRWETRQGIHGFGMAGLLWSPVHDGGTHDGRNGSCGDDGLSESGGGGAEGADDTHAYRDFSKLSSASERMPSTWQRCRSMTVKGDRMTNPLQSTRNRTKQQNVWDHRMSALRLLRRARRHTARTLPKVLHTELRAIQARLAATALHVRVFAPNEARNATSLGGLDFVVRGDLDGKPLIEVHLPAEKDTETPRHPGLVQSSCRTTQTSGGYSPSTATLDKTGKPS